MKATQVHTIILSIFLATFASVTQAKAAFIGEDFSGQYRCKGNNDAVGEYEVKIALVMNSDQSHDEIGVYDFVVTPDDQETYAGQAVAYSRRVALTFKLPTLTNAQNSTGVGFFKKLDAKRWRFTNYYYEPNADGGVTGFEYCKQVK